MFSTPLIGEAMAQPFYPADGEVSFGSHLKRDALSIENAIQSNRHPDIVDRNLTCINTAQEMEAKGRAPTRRRIPVACVRCRKRKIRCSGDAGDGLGCSNCQNTGSMCQFLRVNSAVCQTKVRAPITSGWPYPTNDTASQRLGIYPSSSKRGGVPVKFPEHRISQFSRAPEYEVVPDTQHLYARQAYNIGSTINSEDEPSTTYHIQATSAYTLPNSPQVFIPEYCGMGLGSKGWNVALQGNRAPPGTVLSEGEDGSPLATAAYPYMISGQGPQSNEALSMAPPQAPPQGSLTSPTQETERTLPNPTNGSPFPENTNSPTSNMDGPQPAHDYKACSRWIARCDHRVPAPPTSNVSFNITTMDRPKPIPSSGQDVAFGFLPVASNSAPSSTISAPGTFSSLEPTVCLAEASDEFRGNSDNRYRTLSRDSRRMVSASDYRPNTYGYSRPAYRNRSEQGESNSESTLITGFPYTRPTHSVSLSQLDEKPGPQVIARHPSYTGLCSQ